MIRIARITAAGVGWMGDLPLGEWKAGLALCKTRLARKTHHRASLSIAFLRNGPSSDYAR